MPCLYIILVLTRHRGYGPVHRFEGRIEGSFRTGHGARVRVRALDRMEL